MDAKSGAVSRQHTARLTTERHSDRAVLTNRGFRLRMFGRCQFILSDSWTLNDSQSRPHAASRSFSPVMKKEKCISLEKSIAHLRKKFLRASGAKYRLFWNCFLSQLSLFSRIFVYEEKTKKKKERKARTRRPKRVKREHDEGNKREREENRVDIASRIDRFLVKSYSRCCGRWWIIFRIRPVPAGESFAPSFWLRMILLCLCSIRALSLCTHRHNSSASLFGTLCSILRRYFSSVFVFSAGRVIAREQYSSLKTDIEKRQKYDSRQWIKDIFSSS